MSGRSAYETLDQIISVINACLYEQFPSSVDVMGATNAYRELFGYLGIGRDDSSDSGLAKQHSGAESERSNSAR